MNVHTNFIMAYRVHNRNYFSIRLLPEGRHLIYRTNFMAGQYIMPAPVIEESNMAIKVGTIGEQKDFSEEVANPPKISLSLH